MEIAPQNDIQRNFVSALKEKNEKSLFDLLDKNNQADCLSFFAETAVFLGGSEKLITEIMKKPQFSWTSQSSVNLLSIAVLSSRHDLFDCLEQYIEKKSQKEKEELVKEALLCAVERFDAPAALRLIPMSRIAAAHAALQTITEPSDFFRVFSGVFQQDEKLCRLGVIALCATENNLIEEKMSFFLPLLTDSSLENILGVSVFVGNMKALKIIVGFSDPKANESAALQSASTQKNQEIFEYLYKISDPSAALLSMKSKNSGDSKMLEDRIKIDQDKKELLFVTKGKSSKLRPKKM